MLRYAARRALQFVPTFVGVTLLVFLLLRLAPGDPATAEGDLSLMPTAASLAEWRHLKGMDQPLYTQYLRWLWSCVSFDFGTSLFDERPVRVLILEALPRTLLLTSLALVCTYALAIPLGVHSAAARGTKTDTVLSTLVFVLYSLPTFWVALVLLVLFGGGQFWHIFPVRGLSTDGLEDAALVVRGLDFIWHLVLPVCCLTYPGLARTSRYQRAAMLEVLSQDFVRTARAKGLSERRVIWRHAWPNALVPVLALLSVDLPWLVGGSVIVERVFTIRGMGLLTFEAILRRDYPVILGVTALVAMTTMVGMLVGDLALAWADPRIRYPARPR
ncbi:MAG: ABC transporter permease [Deltaproteobacteria bacterium]|nr:ABC transporter permease [Deltaproteobacteria bacterium]